MKMKNLFWVLLTALLLMTGACSKQDEEDTVTNSTKSPEESNAPSSTSDLAGNAENNDQSVEKDQQSDDQDTNLEHDTDSEASSRPGESEDNKTTNENDFDVESYLNKNYAIENTHYKADIWKNEKTGKAEYTIKIIPNTKEFSQEMNKKFQNAGMEIYEETELMFNKAEQIMKDLPQLDVQIHIYSVNWVSYDGDFNIMLIQDFR